LSEEKEYQGRILFVEDEEDVLNSLVRFFSSRGFEVHGARSAEAAISLVQTVMPDIAVLDVMLQEGPGESIQITDGYEVCRQLRQIGFERPIIFLTARSSENDKLIGFEVGADDFVTKPFSLPVLLARIQANLRRAGGVKRIYRFGEVEVDLDMHEIRHPQDDAEQLSKRECDLLTYFIQNRGVILSREQLLSDVWGYKSGIATRTVDTHVLTVRKKLRDSVQTPVFIQTLHGVGYRFIGAEDK
jgi:DNA-binding response OmpR family regulator